MIQNVNRSSCKGPFIAVGF